MSRVHVLLLSAALGWMTSGCAHNSDLIKEVDALEGKASRWKARCERKIDGRNLDGAARDEWKEKINGMVEPVLSATKPLRDSLAQHPEWNVSAASLSARDQIKKEIDALGKRKCPNVAAFESATTRRWTATQLQALVQKAQDRLFGSCTPRPPQPLLDSESENEMRAEISRNLTEIETRIKAIHDGSVKSLDHEVSDVRSVIEKMPCPNLAKYAAATKARADQAEAQRQKEARRREEALRPLRDFFATAKRNGATHVMGAILAPGTCRGQVDGSYICQSAAICEIDAYSKALEAEPNLPLGLYFMRQVASRDNACEGAASNSFVLETKIKLRLGMLMNGIIAVRRGQNTVLTNVYGASILAATWISRSAIFGEDSSIAH